MSAAGALMATTWSTLAMVDGMTRNAGTGGMIVADARGAYPHNTARSRDSFGSKIWPRPYLRPNRHASCSQAPTSIMIQATMIRRTSQLCASGAILRMIVPNTVGSAGEHCSDDARWVTCFSGFIADRRDERPSDRCLSKTSTITSPANLALSIPVPSHLPLTRILSKRPCYDAGQPGTGFSRTATLARGAGW